MSSVSRVYGQQVSMEWDNEFMDNGNMEAGSESLDNTRTWLQTLDRGQVSVTSAASSVDTSRRSSMDLDLSRGKSVMSSMFRD